MSQKYEKLKTFSIIICVWLSIYILYILYDAAEIHKVTEIKENIIS